MNDDVPVAARSGEESSVTDDMASGPEPGDRIERLREQGLLRAGYPAELARELAAREDVDFRQAIALVRHGFPPELAARMLLSGERPVF
jgi:hypothetical protein